VEPAVIVEKLTDVENESVQKPQDEVDVDVPVIRKK
jgi:hypothetical protein